jgi:hypothetical protein
MDAITLLKGDHRRFKKMLEEGEDDMFKKARAVLDKAELIELGGKMQAMKQRTRRAA